METFDPKIHQGIKTVLIVLGGLALALAFSNVSITPAHAAVSCPIIGTPGFPCIFPEVGSPSAAFPPSNPSSLRLDSLPACLDTFYGATLRWETANATSSTIELWQGSTFLWSGTIDYPPDGLATWWQGLINLIPGTTYSWRVKASNSYGSSAWAWGPNISVPPCGAPPVPSNFTVTGNFPQCSDTAYGGITTNFSISPTTVEIEVRLMKDGLAMAIPSYRDSFEPGYTGYSITWAYLFPNADYYIEAHARNDLGWSDWARGPSWSVPACTPPDLITRFWLPWGAGLGFEPYWVAPGTTVTFAGNVCNFSPSPTDSSFSVQWYVNNSPISGKINGVSGSTHGALSEGRPLNSNIYVCEAGNHDTSSYRFNSEGTYAVKFCSDITQVVSETDETNNCTTVDINVGTPPDLQVQDTSSISSRSGLTAYLKHWDGSDTEVFYQGETMFVEIPVETINYPVNESFWIDVWAPFLLVPSVDSDNDGYTNAAESFMGTDPSLACGANAWPPDFNSDGIVQIDDVTAVSSRFGAKVGDPEYSPRYEVASQDGVIHIDDIMSVNSRFGRICSVSASSASSLSPFLACNQGNPTDSLLVNGIATSPMRYNLDFPAPAAGGYILVRVDSRGADPYHCAIKEQRESNNFALTKRYSVRTLPPGEDFDGDGFTNQAEIFMGTDPTRACGYNAWPPDFNSDGMVHIDDVTFVSARFGAREGEPLYTKRAELASQDGKIHIEDVVKVTGAFGKRCQY